MNRNIRIARQLVRIARELVAESDVKTLQEVIDNKGQVPKETLEDAKDIIEDVMKDPEAQEMLKKMQENTPEGKKIRRQVEHGAFVDAHVAATGIGKKIMLLALLALITVPQLAGAAPRNFRWKNKGGAGMGKKEDKAKVVQMEQKTQSSKPFVMDGEVTPKDVLDAVEGKCDIQIKDGMNCNVKYHPVVGYGANGETYIGVAESLSTTMNKVDAGQMCLDFLQDAARMVQNELGVQGRLDNTGAYHWDYENGVGFNVFVLTK